MRASNLAEVGHTRSRRGISMNMRMKDEHLYDCQMVPMQWAVYSHQYYTEDDEQVEVEDVCNAQCEAEYDTQNT